MKNYLFLALSAATLMTGNLSAETAAVSGTLAPEAATKDLALAQRPPQSPQQGGYKEIDTRALQALMASKTPFIIIDARTAQFDDGRRIPGARLLSPTASSEQIAATIPSKNTLVIVYCASTRCPLSKNLAERLVAFGYTNVQKYPQGLEGWSAAGNKIENVRH